MKSLYTAQYEVLESAGIKSQRDLLQLTSSMPMSWAQYRDSGKPAGARGVSSAHHGWVAALVDRIEEDYGGLARLFAEQNVPRVASDRMYDSFMVAQWNPADPVFKARANLSCLFPHRLLFTSHQVIRWVHGETWVPFDYLALLLALRPALEMNLTWLLPVRIRHLTHGPTWMDENIASIYTLLNKDVEFTIPASGMSHSALLVTANQRLSVEAGSAQALLLPWLYGLDLERAVEVVCENEASFDAYSNSLTRFFAGISSEEDAPLKWVRDVDSAVERLNDVYSIEQEKHRKAGRNVFLGLSITLLSQLVPGVSTQLAAVAGGKAIIDGITWLRHQPASNLKHDPMWSIWETVRRSGR